MGTSGQQGMAMDAEKQTLVRVKRKRNDDPFETLWLELTPRPAKRQEADLSKLSLNETTTVPQGGTGSSSRMLYQRVETLTSSGVRDINVSDFLLRVKKANNTQEKREDTAANTFEETDKHRQTTAKAPLENSVGRASFQQIWQSRKRSQLVEADPMQDFFRLYDVVRIDDEEDAANTGRRSQAKREAEDELRQGQLLCNYLPMLRDVLPSAASEIEADSASSYPDDYVYDVYIMNNGKVDSEMRDALGPLVKIREHEFWDEEEDVESDLDSEDSNCEGNPHNDYPEEESSSLDITPYGSDDEEYATVLTDDEENFRTWR